MIEIESVAGGGGGTAIASVAFCTVFAVEVATIAVVTPPMSEPASSSAPTVCANAVMVNVVASPDVAPLFAASTTSVAGLVGSRSSGSTSDTQTGTCVALLFQRMPTAFELSSV